MALDFQVDQPILVLLVDLLDPSFRFLLSNLALLYHPSLLVGPLVLANRAHLVVLVAQHYLARLLNPLDHDLLWLQAYLLYLAGLGILANLVVQGLLVHQVIQRLLVHLEFLVLLAPRVRPVRLEGLVVRLNLEDLVRLYVLAVLQDPEFPCFLVLLFHLLVPVLRAYLEVLPCLVRPDVLLLLVGLVNLDCRHFQELQFLLVGP